MSGGASRAYGQGGGMGPNPEAPDVNHDLLWQVPAADVRESDIMLASEGPTKGAWRVIKTARHGKTSYINAESVTGVRRLFYIDVEDVITIVRRDI